MSTPVPLRSDFDTIGLRMLARRSRDPDQTRRLLALAEIYDGGSRPDAARIGGVGVQIVRDWVVRFNAKGPDGLLTGKAPGAPSILDERQRQALRQVVEDGPIPALHGVVRWRLIDLAQWLFEEFRVSISKPTLSRELRHMAFASSRRDRAIMRKTRKPRRLLKKLSRPRGGDSRKRGSWQADRDLVSRRSSDRAEKQGHPPMGETRDTAFGAARPEDEFGLYFRRHLPGRRKRRRARTTLLQQ